MVFQLSFSMLQQDEVGKPLCSQLCVSLLSRHTFPAALAQSWLDTAMKPTLNPESGDGAPKAQWEPFHLLDDLPPGRIGRSFSVVCCSYQGYALSQHSPGTHQQSPDSCLKCTKRQRSTSKDVVHVIWVVC